MDRPSPPAIPQTIDEIIAHRNKALELATQAFALLHEANEAYRRAGGRSFQFLSHFSHPEWQDAMSGRFDRPIKSATHRIDADVWRHLLRMSGLRTLMDAETSKSFHQSLKEEPPAVTAINIATTFRGLYARKDEIFTEGMINVFASLCRKKASNDAFKLEKKIILTGVLSDYGWDSLSYGEEKVRDIERVFFILDGKPMPAYGDLSDHILKARREGTDELDTEYFHVRLFKNGNLHLIFTRPDLVAKANKLIARHYGEVLAKAYFQAFV